MAKQTSGINKTRLVILCCYEWVTGIRITELGVYHTLQFADKMMIPFRDATRPREKVSLIYQECSVAVLFQMIQAAFVSGIEMEGELA